MAAPRSRRRRGAPLGQIPLSSGEIELYSRQDEAARRRRRLLAVRDQERRLAQQVTQRYRSNLHKLQRGKSDRAQQQLSEEQRQLLTELHRRYQSSLQSMGTAQRNARAKLLELMEQAQQEQHKWNYNRQVAGHQRVIEAVEEQEQDEAERTARRRQVEQNMQRLKVLSGQQREHASARARQEQEVAKQRAKDREEIDRLRRLQSPEEVFVTPRPHKKDVQAYQFTRTHCVPPAPVVSTERPEVTVIRHNRKHPTAMRGDEEAKEFSEQVDQKRERDRLVVEEQGETAAQRGRSALDEETSRKQGQQALEWLALVDKVERRTRGQDMGGGDEYPLDAVEADRRGDDPERMAERAFARMLGLDEDSIELSAFSIDTDDDQSVGLADTDHELSDGDKIEEAEMEKVKIKTAKDNDLLDSLDSGRLRSRGKGEQVELTPGKLEKPFKGTSDEGLERDELEKPKKADDAQDNGVASKGVEASRSGLKSTEHEDNVSKINKYPAGDGSAKGVAVPPNVPHFQRKKDTRSGDRTSARDERRRRDTYGGVEERPEGTDSEDDQMSPGTQRLGRENGSIERLESRLQEVLDLRLPRPQQGRPHEEDGESLSSASEAGQRVSQLDGAPRRSSPSPRTHDFPRASDGARMASVASLSAASSEVDFSRSEVSEMAVSGVRRSISSASERSTAYGRDLHPREQLLDSRRGSIAANERGEMRGEGRASMGVSSLANSGGEFEARQLELADSAPNAMGQSGNAGDNGLGTSVASFRSSYPSVYGGEERHYDGNVGSVEQGAGHLVRQSVQTSVTEGLGSSHGSIIQRAQALLDEREERLSSSSNASHDEDLQEAGRILNSGNSSRVSIAEDQRSVSESSFAPSQKSLSRLGQVANERAKSLGQRFIDEQMMSFSSSEGPSDGEEDEGGFNIRRPSVHRDDAQTTVNIDPFDPYRQQIHHRVRGGSSSAVSIAQYSLPPSDTQSSFDDSLGRLDPGYGEDSFVNQLVPMFPRRALPPPPQSLEEDSQSLQEYDVQLVAPNMSRMLTSERRTSFGRSRQRPVHQERPQVGATDHPQSHAASGVTRRGEVNTRPTPFDYSSRQSSSASSSDEMDSRSIDSSVGEIPRRQQLEVKRMPIASRGDTRQRFQGDQDRKAHRDAVDAQSDVSSDSGVSSLGFTVQLNLAAGTSRRRNDNDSRRDASRHAHNRQNTHVHQQVTDDELENQSIASERSFASSSSLSMDAHFNYLVNTTSAVGKSLPLHLRLPAAIYGKKDMTKPPAPMAWSTSSVSSVASVSEVDPNEDPETGFARRSIPRSSSSISDSLLEEQHLPPSRPANVHQTTNQHARGSAASYRSKALDSSSDNESTGSGEAARRLTFDSIEEKVAQLPPPPLGSLNLSQPPPPMQKLDRSLNDSQASSEQHSDDFRSPTRLPPPPVGSLDMSRPPPPMQDFNRSLDDSHSSSEPRSERFQSSKKRDVRFQEAEEERKHGDSSSDSGASSYNDGSFSSSSASSRRHSVKRAEKLVIPVKKAEDNNAEDQSAEEMSLAEAFQRRHPGFGRRMESHRDKLKRQRDKQQQEQQQQEAPRNVGTTRDTEKGGDAASPRGGRATDALPPEKQEVLDRLASGSRAKISSREMKERSRRLYHQLPEVVERKRQEEVMRRRRERLDELRQQEKERRLQQKYRRQQQQMRR